MLRILAALTIAGSLLASGCAGAGARGGSEPPPVVSLAPVAAADLQDLSVADLDKFLSTSEQNVLTSTAEKERRREGTLVAWAASIAGVCALIAILATIGLFVNYQWILDFKPLLGEIALVAGALACLLGWAAWKMHSILSWLPWLALGAGVALTIRLVSKYWRTWRAKGRGAWNNVKRFSEEVKP